MNNRTLQIAAIASLVLAGAGVALIVQSPGLPGASPATPVAPASADIAALRARLDVQAARVAALEARVAALQPRSMAVLIEADDDEPAPEQADAAPAEANLASVDAGSPPRADAGGLRRNLPIEERRRRLAESGFNAAEIDAMISRVDALQFARTELRYRAAREGWTNTQRYRDELRAIPDARTAITEEFGERGYDSYLYSLDRPNRIAIDTVLTDTPAQRAGLQPGDVVMRYDGARVYRVRDIMLEAARGEPDETVSIEALRGDSVVTVYVPRGPVGFSASEISVRPR